MENNEYLTSWNFRIENNIKITSRTISMYNEKIAKNKEELLNLTKINEQTEYDYNVIFSVC